MKNKFFIIALLVSGLFLAAFMYLKNDFEKNAESNPYSATTADQNAPPFQVVPFDQNILVKPHAPFKGSLNAQITVVEFLDPECESCSAMYPMVKQIYEEYKADIRLVVRYMTFHKNSKYVANILEGARAENKYWEALELLFQTQELWANHHNPKPELIPELLKPLNLNIKKIVSDAKAGKYDKQIIEDIEDGKKVGVRGTPTFFVNGKQVEELGYEPLKNEIESRLESR